MAYCWKNPLGEATAENSRTTSVSRAWKRSAVWLRNHKNTKDVQEAASDKWRLLQYARSQPDPAQATQQQIVAMSCFQVWRKELSRGQLNDKHWVEMLLHVAEKQAMAEDNAASTASVLKWTSWLYE